MTGQQTQHDGDKAPGPAERGAALAPPKAEAERESLAGRGFRAVEQLLLIVVTVMTLAAAGFEIRRVYLAGEVNLADILLMFLYTEVIGMIAVFYTGRGSPFIYPIFIAITALARLIVLQGKDMAPENIVFEAGAILLLAISSVIILRASKS
ncbi:phosphate-starvation-inducible protein PsiE [Roseomonas rosulenta]|uniref:phosphate-starvation-inducible protein PsiE n=1 Tax=Roseomonas rosulenta TaxID=2748667 RepID=UPI0018DFF5DD|nr:phosphate-starvation-inducible PsiE family protein [Roseomonas rosulenta]